MEKVSEDIVKTVNVYSMRDKVRNRALMVCISESDGLVIRENAPSWSKVIPLGDIEIYQIGTFNENTQEIISCEPRLVDWNTYKFPESPLKNNN